MTYIDSLFNLRGKVVVITGAGGHLCSEMARSFAKAGCSLVLLDLRLDKVERLRSSLSQSGFHNAIAEPLNVSSKNEHEHALKVTLERFDRVDVLINGAGINGPTPILDLQLEEWYAILDSQLTGTLLGSQVFGAQMLSQGSGSIINISSASADPPLSKAFSYSVAKAGIVNLTKNIAREWATAGVRVNAIRPGFFPTDWNRKNFITPEREQAILGHTPMERYGDPSELTGAVLWLASDASSFVTGTEVTVDGGFSCMTI
jgi:NAD(P)-dependent dehydrogenase (short-subunit alcohol dehydrogenase family)